MVWWLFPEQMQWLCVHALCAPSVSTCRSPGAVLAPPEVLAQPAWQVSVTLLPYLKWKLLSARMCVQPCGSVNTCACV